MVRLSPMLMAGLTGFLSALALSIPVGPVNLTIINEGARRGFFWALLIGMGATVMEVIYCFIAFTGFASIFDQGYIKVGMQLFSFVFILLIAVRFLTAKSVDSPVRLGAAAERIQARLGERYHPHSAFMTGLVQVMGNLGVLVFWVFLATSFIFHGWVTPDWPGKLSCVAGVALGTGFWFLVLAWIVSLGHGKFSQGTLLRIEHLSGVGLLVVALIHGGRIMWEMHKANLLRLP